MTWTKARAEKAAWRKRGYCGFVPNSLFHIGPALLAVSTGSEKRGLWICPVVAQRPVTSTTRGCSSSWVDWPVVISPGNRPAGEQALTGPPQFLLLPKLRNLHRPEGLRLTQSPARFWFTLLASGDTGVCAQQLSREEVLWLNVSAWQIFFFLRNFFWLKHRLIVEKAKYTYKKCITTPQPYPPPELIMLTFWYMLSLGFIYIYIF